MNNKLILIKSINLLYRESQQSVITDNSADLVLSVISDIKKSNINLGVGDERDIIDNLKNTAINMCRNPADTEYIKEELLQTLYINSGNDKKLYNIIKQSISTDLSESGLKRSILSLKNTLTNYFKELTIGDILNKASYEFKFNKEKIKSTEDFISKVMTQLESIQFNTKIKDPAVVNELDIGDNNSLKEMFKSIIKTNHGNVLYKTGWVGLNKMLQGGFRPGLTMIGALPHRYKTGFTLSIFKQIALYNTPLTQDTTKKPLLLRISFEDDLDLNIQFLYQSLKYDELKKDVDLKNLDEDDMSNYIKKKLQINNFHIKLIRVDPSLWTYRSICNKIIELEAEGYNVEVLVLDYLSKVPTTGCNGGGIIGEDLCDMFNRLRNFCSSRKICCITPHQLSTEAKNLIRNGVPEEDFVKIIDGKGYYQRSKALDTIVDCELLIHVFKTKKDGVSYLSIQRGKHRIPTIIDEKDKYLLLPFPKKMPIPDDVGDGIDISYSSLKEATSKNNNDMFSDF